MNKKEPKNKIHDIYKSTNIRMSAAFMYETMQARGNEIISIVPKRRGVGNASEFIKHYKEIEKKL